MASSNRNNHFTIQERHTVETSIFNGSATVAIAKILGKETYIGKAQPDEF